MKYLFAIALLFCALSARSQVQWKYIGAEVENNGWVLKLTLSTSPDLGNAPAVTNLAFFNGFLTNAEPSVTNGLTLNILSPGFNSSGVSNQVSRTSFGTRLLRLAYPMQNTNDIIAQNVTNVMMRLALSEWVMSNDVVTVSGLAGAVASTNLSAFTNSSSFTGQTVTNNSTVAWRSAKAIGHFASAQRVPINGTETIEVFAVQSYGREGNPVARVLVTATGATSANVVSGSATEITKSSREDKLPVYAVTLDLSTGAGFTRGETVDINFKAWPHVGDTNAILDATLDAGVSIFQLGALKRTIMSKMICRVDLSTGNDLTCVASTVQGTADASPALTISGALTAIAATNNTLYSLNRLDGGEVQCNTGEYRTGKYAAQASTSGYFTITRHSSATAAGVIFTNYVTSQNQYAYQRYYDVTFKRQANGYLVFAANPNVLIMEKVLFYDGFTAWYSGDTGTDIEFIDCVTTNSVFSRGGNDGHSRLIRNVTYTNMANSSLVFGKASCVFGAKVVGGSGSSVWQPLTTVPLTNAVLAFCNIKSLPSDYFLFAGTNVCNFAVVGNVVERIGASASPLAELTPQNNENWCWWDNTFVGQRWNHENDIAAPLVNISYQTWSIRGNSFDSRGDHRADIYNANATMIGTWAVGYSVGWSGNWNEGYQYAGDSDFWGMNSLAPNPPGLSFTAKTNAAIYTANLSQSVTNTGDGNYRLLSRSPVFSLKAGWRTPFDLDGFPRSQIDPPGAYSSGNVKKGAFF